MKTAMQELIEEILCEQEIYFDENGDFLKVPNIQYVNAYKSNVDLSEYIKKALEKEKEQIMNAYCDGAKGGANGTKGPHEFGWVSRHSRNKYYNETYKQNK
jgi:hypothetical protein